MFYWKSLLKYGTILVTNFFELDDKIIIEINPIVHPLLGTIQAMEKFFDGMLKLQ